MTTTTLRVPWQRPSPTGGPAAIYMDLVRRHVEEMMGFRHQRLVHVETRLRGQVLASTDQMR